MCEGVVHQSGRGNKPPAPAFPIDRPLRFHSLQGFSERNAGCGKQVAQFSLGRELATGRQRAIVDLRRQGVMDGGSLGGDFFCHGDGLDDFRALMLSQLMISFPLRHTTDALRAHLAHYPSDV